ncbi:copper resistance protein CopD|nr:copper resistance protein CopD [Candidatus Pantoea persica]
METLWILLAGCAFYTALLAPVRYRAALAQRLKSMMSAALWLVPLSALLMLTTQHGSVPVAADVTSTTARCGWHCCSACCCSSAPWR